MVSFFKVDCTFIIFKVDYTLIYFVDEEKHFFWYFFMGDLYGEIATGLQVQLQT